MDCPTIAAEGICKSYDGVEVIGPTSFAIEPRTAAAFVSPSGSGKSTLLSMLGLILTPTQGDVLVGGRGTRNLSDGERSALRGRTVGFVFQHTQLIGSLRAWENVTVPARFSGRGAVAGIGGGGSSAAACGARGAAGGAGGDEGGCAGAGGAGFAGGDGADSAAGTGGENLEGEGRPAAGEERARELLARFGLSERADHYPYQLSIGQKRRVACARALMLAPPVLIADEPTNDLDADSADSVTRALFEHVERGGILLFATHDSALCEKADRVFHLEDRRFVQ